MGSATLSGSTISNNTAADDGGAIYQIGTSSLTISNSTFSGNSADPADSVADGGAIYSSSGTINMTGTTLSGNTAGGDGGGVFNIGTSTLTMSNSTVSGNTAGGDGGGIFNNNTATLSGVTINGNVANDAFFGGGGINNSGGMLTLTNSTVSGNSAKTHGGGIRHSTSNSAPTSLLLASVTITGNTADSGNDGVGDGGGLQRVPGGTQPDTTELKNTIVAGNTDSSTATKHPDCSGTVTTGGHNLIGDGTGCTGPSHGVSGDQVGTSGSLVNPQLGSLADNGGPTKTHALQSGSPAIDAGNPAGCTDKDNVALTTDQRGTGFPRSTDGDGVSGARCDIGAFEKAAAPTTATITVVKDVAGGTNPQDFNFQIQPGNPGGLNFNLDDDTDPTLLNSATNTNFTAGVQQTISEAALPSGWSLSSIACVHDATGSPYAGAAISLANRTAILTPAAGEHVRCTFTNTEQGSLSLSQTSVPQGQSVTIFGSGFKSNPGDTVVNICRDLPATVDCGAVRGTEGFADGTGHAALFNEPSGIAVDSTTGNVYVGDTQNHRVRKVTPAGTVTTLAGSGTAGSADGTGTAAQFNFPMGLAVDSGGNVYVADAVNNKIRKIDPNGVVSTLAGSGTGGAADGAANTAQFQTPHAVAVDGSGNVYVADANNQKVRKIAGGQVSTVASNVAASGIAVDSAGTVLYVAGGQVITKITSPGGTPSVSTFAGSTMGFAEGTGAAAQFNNATGVALDSGGNVWVADLNNFRIRRITSGGTVSTFAGSGTPGSQDGSGSTAQFNDPWAVGVDSSGNLYVADRVNNNRVRKITPESVVSTLAGGAGFVTSAFPDTLGSFQQSVSLTDTAVWTVGTHSFSATGSPSERTARITFEVTAPATGGGGGAGATASATLGALPAYSAGQAFAISFSVQAPQGVTVNSAQLRYQKRGLSTDRTTFKSIALTGSLSGGSGTFEASVPGTEAPTEGLDFWGSFTFSDGQSASSPTSAFHNVFPPVTLAGQKLLFDYDSPACPTPGPGTLTLTGRVKQAGGNTATKLKAATLKYRNAGFTDPFTSVTGTDANGNALPADFVAGSVSVKFVISGVTGSGVEVYLELDDSNDGVAVVNSVRVPPQGATPETFIFCQTTGGGGGGGGGFAAPNVNIMPMFPMAGVESMYFIGASLEVTLPTSGKIRVGFQHVHDPTPDEFSFTQCTAQVTACTKVDPGYKTQGTTGFMPGFVDFASNGEPAVNPTTHELEFTVASQITASSTAPVFINFPVVRIKNTSKPNPLIFTGTGVPSGGYTGTVQFFDASGNPLTVKRTSMPFPMNNPASASIITGRVVEARQDCLFGQSLPPQQTPDPCKGLNDVTVEASGPGVGTLTTTTGTKNLGTDGKVTSTGGVQVEGVFEFKDLPADHYSITARGSNTHLAPQWPMFVPVGFGFPPPPIQLRMTPSAGLNTVTVNISGGPTGKTTEVQVMAWSPLGLGFFNATATLDTTGAGTATHKLPAGTWTLNVMPAMPVVAGFGAAATAPQMEFFMPPPKDVTVPTNQPVTFQLQSSNLEAQVKVVDQNGDPVEGAMVMIWSPNPGGTGGRTGGDGVYKGKLPAGVYNVKVWVSGGAFDLPEVQLSISADGQNPGPVLIYRVNIAGNIVSGKAVKVTENCAGGTPTSVALANAWLSANGVDASGTPLPGRWYNTNTDSSGSFKFLGVTDANLEVRGHGDVPIPPIRVNNIAGNVTNVQLKVCVENAVNVTVDVGGLGIAGVNFEPVFPGPGAPPACNGTPFGALGGATAEGGKGTYSIGQKPAPGDKHCYKVGVQHPVKGRKILKTIAIDSDGKVYDAATNAEIVDKTITGAVDTGTINITFTGGTVKDGFVDASSETEPGNAKLVRNDAASTTLEVPAGDQSTPYTVKFGAKGLGSQNKTVQVTKDQTVQVEFPLPATKTITVTVQDAVDNTKKIKGARVRALKKVAAGAVIDFVNEAETNDNGVAELTVPVGFDYDIFGSKGDSLPAAPQTVTNITDDKTLEQPFNLKAKTAATLKISGQVSEGNSVVACYEDANDDNVFDDGTILADADANGNYECPVTAGRKYLVKGFKEGKKTEDTAAKQVTIGTSSFTGQNINLSSITGFTAKKGKEKLLTQTEPGALLDAESNATVTWNANTFGSSTSSKVSIITRDVTGSVPHSAKLTHHKSVEITAKDAASGNRASQTADVTVKIKLTASEASGLSASQKASIKVGVYDPKTGETAAIDKGTTVVLSDGSVEVSCPAGDLTGSKFTLFSAGAGQTISSTGTGTGTSPGGGGGGGGAQPTPTPTPVPTFASQSISPAAGGTVTLGSTSVSVSGGAVTTAATASLETVALTGQGVAPVLAAAAQQTVPFPEGSAFGSGAFSFTLKDAAGTALSLLQPATVTAKYTFADRDKAGGDIAGVRLMVYDPAANRWVDLKATADELKLTLTGSTTMTGLFAIVVELPKPALVGPAAGFLSLDLAPLLSWTNPAGTTQYQIQLIPFNSDGPGINLIRNAEESYQVQAPVFGQGNYVMLPGMSYTWRVRTSTATTGLGEHDPGWSKWASGSFKTAPPSSSTIGIVGPIPGSEVASRTPTLTWSNSNKSVFYYEVQASKDPNFGPDAFLYWELRHAGVTTPQNSYKIPDQFPLEAGTAYYWRVRPRVQGDGTPVGWSQVWSFSTPP